MQELQAQDLQYDETLAAFDMMAMPDDLDKAAPLEDMDICSDRDF